MDFPIQEGNYVCHLIIRWVSCLNPTYLFFINKIYLTGAQRSNSAAAESGLLERGVIHLHRSASPSAATLRESLLLAFLLLPQENWHPK